MIATSSNPLEANAAFLKEQPSFPFASSIYNRGEVQTARDIHGAVRFLCTGGFWMTKTSINCTRRSIVSKNTSRWSPWFPGSNLSPPGMASRVSSSAARSSTSSSALSHTAVALGRYASSIRSLPLRET
jgi:hypothetical protein